MPFQAKYLRLAALGTLGLLAAATSANAQMMSAGDYNSPWGMSATQENQSVNPSLRDSNGNLSVVNGVFTSSQFGQQMGVQQTAVGGSSLAAAGAGAGGITSIGGSQFGGTAGSTAMASAIGNSLNVVTVGNNNTVVVNSSQTNNGNQSANVSVNGH